MCIASPLALAGPDESAQINVTRNWNRWSLRVGGTSFTSAASFMVEVPAARAIPAVSTVALIVFVNISKPQNKMYNVPIALDLFCGVGGMSLGFEQAGFKVAAAVEIDEINVQTYARNFPQCLAWCTDLSLASAAQVRRETGIGDRPIDVAFAGPPCQGFSMIGKRLREDPRNLLLYEFARLIAELSPRYFVVENVEGILVGSAKDMLDEFVARVERAGYLVVKPIRVLDAVEFGVPQRRRRVFVLGCREGLTLPRYPRPPYSYDQRVRIATPTVWDAIGDLPNVGKFEYLLRSDEYRGDLRAPSPYAQVLRGEVRDPGDHSLERHVNGAGLTGCLRTLHTPKTVKRFAKTRPGTYDEVSRFYRLSRNGFAPTIRAGTGPQQGSFTAARPIHPFQNRCITVREAARLHSFPDWFVFHPTKWHGFRQIGNSVPPRLARALAESIRRAIDNL
jgi:DNA (cytosine-5)-methyltransferase 1